MLNSPYPLPDADADLALPDDLVESLLALSAEVSESLRAHYSNAAQIAVEHKSDKSPVTAADIAAHQLIASALGRLTPDIPILSEESDEADIRDRRSWSRFWLVDPLDGTKEFLDGTGEFTVNIALIAAQRPVLGLIAVPTTHEVFLGIPGAGAWRLGPDAEALDIADTLGGGPLRILASRRHHPDAVAKIVGSLERMGYASERINAGSALKFCTLAMGDGDLYPRTSPCYEWDIAAGDALVTAAGGFMVNRAGEPVAYNASDSLLATPFVAGRGVARDWPSLLE